MYTRLAVNFDVICDTVEHTEMATQAQQSSGPLPSEKQLKHSLKNLKYTQHGLTARHIMASMESFPELKPSIKEYSYIGTGRRAADLMQLSGNISVKALDQELHIPVRVWLEKGYPKDKPIVYINPTSDMAFTSVPYVVEKGKVDLFELLDWKEGKSDLNMLVQLLRSKFNQQCPVYPIRLRSSSGLFMLPRLNSSNSVINLRASYQCDSPITPAPVQQPVTNRCGHDKELIRMKLEIDRQKSKIEKLADGLEESNGKVEYFRNKVSEMEERIKAQKVTQRGSFSTGVFDALMQHDVWKEKQEKEEYRERMGKMVTELTELRETIGILNADKEEYKERLALVAVEYEHMKRDYCRLVKERKFILHRPNATRSDSHLLRQKRKIEDRSSTSTEDSESLEDDSNCLNGRTEIPDTKEGEQKTKEIFKETKHSSVSSDLSSPLENGRRFSKSQELTSEASPVRLSSPSNPQFSGEANQSIEEQTRAKPWEKKTNSEQNKHETEMEDLKQQNKLLREQINNLKERNEIQESEIESLRKSQAEQGQGEGNELLKKLLDDALRKIKKFEYSSDKEEQLEKQKQFLQSQLDRCIEDRTKVEKKLKDENWNIKQKLKEAVKRAEQLEREVRGLQRNSNTTDLSSQEEPSSPVQAQQTSSDDLDGILEHLEVLMSS